VKIEGRESGPTSTIRTFLIADVRGYTRFTREHGDAQAARLAMKFADLARDAIAARGGRVVELRGDEALAVFTSAPQAVGAACDFQATCQEETAADPSLPLAIGIGVDAGESIPVEDGYRGDALNTAARLCSKAAAGQVLVTRAVAELADGVENVRFEGRGPAELKGFEGAVELVEAVPAPLPMGAPGRAPERQASGAGPETTLLPELDSITPLIGREHEMHWLRGTWRQAGRGRGRVVFVSGPAGIGRTRLAAELATEVARGGGRIDYSGPGGASTALAVQAVRVAAEAIEPTLVILDDFDVAGEDAALALAEEWQAVRSRPVMVLGLVKDSQAGPSLAAAIEEADGLGDGHVSLTPLNLDGVEGIARLYVGDDVQDVPLESMARESGGVPGRVHEVVSLWARDEAGRRLAAAAEWLTEGRERRSADLEFANNLIGLKLGRIYSGEGQAAGESECPYKGLASFEETDAEYFFGRERLIGELAARTVQVGLLGVVGASGSGKSSAVAAGLLPSLRAGLLPGSERWRHVMFRPGEHPMPELAAAVGADEPESPNGNALEAAIGRLGTDGRLVLAVDQFEEVFTLCVDSDERTMFIDTLTLAATQWPELVAIVLIIRDDFYGRCAPYPELVELLTGNHVLVPPMTRDELRRAIELPARRARLRVESALANALVAEVAEAPGALPLLSTTLVELWGVREDRWLRLDAYEQTGGVQGAVARLAEASYQQLTGAEREVARRMFLRLAGTGEGEAVTRRRVPLGEFDVQVDPLASDVLARLTEDRLLTMSDSSVEVAHEALLREWPRLRGWLDEDMQGHLLRQHLTQAAKQWDANDRDPSEVYRGARLSAALDWASTRGTDLNELERAFLSAGRQASEREVERQRRTNRRLRGLLVGGAVFLAVALLAGGVALVQRGRARSEAKRAETQAGIATARELTEASLANLGVDPDRSILLALRAVETYRGLGPAVPGDAVETLHKAVENSRLLLTVSDPASGSVAFSPDGKLVATGGSLSGSQNGRADLWDARTGNRVRTLSEPNEGVRQVLFSPDGSELLTRGALSSGTGSIILWNTRTGEKLETLHPRGSLVDAAFSPGGDRVAVSTLEGTLTIYDLRTRNALLRIANPGPLCGVDFSPDGSKVAAAACYTGTTAPVWDARTGRKLIEVGGYGSVITVAFSPDGKRLVTGGIDGIARVWAVRRGRLMATLQGHTGWIYSVAFSPDGRQVATGSSDGTARMWNANTGRQLFVLAAHTETVYEVAFSPDGKHLATASGDGTTRIWDVTTQGARDALTLAADKPGTSSLQVAFSPDGKHLVTGGGDEPFAQLWDAATGKRLAKLRAERDFGDIHYSPNGKRILLSGDGTPAIVDSSLSHVLLRLKVKTFSNFFPGGAWSSNGKVIALGDGDGRATVWDARTGKLLRVLVHSTDAQSGSSAVYRVAFSPDGKELATADWDHTVKLWNLHTGQLLLTIPAHTDQVNAVEFSPDGSRLLTAGSDGLAKVWSLPSGRLVTTLSGHAGAIWDAEFSPNGKLIATAGDDTTARLWNAETGQQTLKLTGSSFALYDVDFSPDGNQLVTGSGDGTVRVYVLPLMRLMSLARARLTHLWTPAECRQYLHLDHCPPGP
jgi:WD40 repeat protein/class 3 adenylate cyclase